MQRILVTGGFGFIGSHLVECLLGAGDRVHVVDDLSSSAAAPAAYVAEIPNRRLLTWDECSVQSYFRGENCAARVYDEIYHLANVVGPVGVLKHAGEILRRTVEDTYAVSDFAAATGARLCFVSTSEVYGGGRGGLCLEKHEAMVHEKPSARSEYAVAKLACEIALRDQAIAGKLHAVMVRPFNVAGPRQSAKGGFVLPRFIRQALAGEDLTVYGAGLRQRAFTHVLDIVDGIIRALRHGKTGRVYNLGNPANRTTILRLAEDVIRISGSRSGIAFVDPTALWGPLFEEANDKYPDASRAMSELGWKPRYGLEETVGDALAYIETGSLA